MREYLQKTQYESYNIYGWDLHGVINREGQILYEIGINKLVFWTQTYLWFNYSKMPKGSHQTKLQKVIKRLVPEQLIQSTRSFWLGNSLDQATSVIPPIFAADRSKFAFDLLNFAAE